MKRNWLGSGVLLAMATAAALVALTHGCGGGGSTTTVTPDTFCTDYASKECQVVSKCGLPDMSACTAVRKTKCLGDVAQRQTATRVFKTSNISACLNQVNNVYSTNGTIPVAKLDQMDDACQYVFQGSVKANSPCTIKYDCDGTMICDKGLCANKVVKNLNDLCGNPGEICNTGSYCQQMGAVYKCVAKHMASEACDVDTNPCLEALRCLNGTCQARADSGGACTSDDDCATAVAYCDPYIGNKCDTGLTFGGGAAACAAFGGSASAGGTGGASGSGGAPGSGGASGDDAGTD